MVRLAWFLIVSACAAFGQDSSLPMLPAPELSPPGGVYEESVLLFMACEPGATCHFTLDGSLPTVQSPIYSNGLILRNPVTVKAIAVKAGWRMSPVTAEAYLVKNRLPTPVIASMTDGPAGAIQVRVQASPGATVVCTQDGSLPDSSGPRYQAPIILSSPLPLALQCQAFQDGWLPSKIIVADFDCLTHCASSTGLLPPGRSERRSPAPGPGSEDRFNILGRLLAPGTR